MMSDTKHGVSVVVPTFREAANIAPLTRRIFSTLRTAGIDGELILVDDDSRDGTEESVKTLADHHPVRLVVRRGERGLSGAVLCGFQDSRFDRLLVLDADLQHPPERIPDLLACLDNPDCDFVLGTRYHAGGSVSGEWPAMRRLVSFLATLAARPLAPMSDPMSGFFALPRDVWLRADKLNPIGYKIALELYVKGRCRRPTEVPIQFGTRAAGTSKASLREGLRFFRHLWRLYWYRFPRMMAMGCAALAILIVALVLWVA